MTVASVLLDPTLIKVYVAAAVALYFVYKW